MAWIIFNIILIYYSNKLKSKINVAWIKNKCGLDHLTKANQRIVTNSLMWLGWLGSK